MTPPPFDANAELHAKGLAVLRKPMARAEGLKALHAKLGVRKLKSGCRFGIGFGVRLAG